jgi:HK97 gp10 family phage protein
LPALGVTILQDTFTPRLVGLTERMKSTIADALDSTGAGMEQLAKSIVTVRTGFLRDSIFHDVAGMDLAFGATAPYASYVELGTWRSRAQPFIRPALDAYQMKLLDALVRGIMAVF